ncbi:methyl-accepting chemotaxis protein [Desulfobotulus sp.]|jgi:methyl-accepting chemotaxis protein|uniref:methyl-accepting chemotaxis protein n=1 Tax=Desulfobotulus sp. TaxID=1940337 RepID=UPI002A3668D1|nr:methyl-accepting chemotaxis protein [Desulfobotulus sp.]MDY0163855.1 methyl-accepting chemotaxis protein [Desulfobotulus sp.]
MTLRKKMIGSVCGVASLAFVLTIWLITSMASEQLFENGQRLAIEAAHRHGGVIKAKMEEPLDAARALAQMLGSIQGTKNAPDRSMVNALLHGLLAANENYWGIWAVWHPEAFDGKDSDFLHTPGSDDRGRFMPYWHRLSGKPELDLSDSSAYDENSPHGRWYWEPFRSGKEFITPPTAYEIGGKQIMLVSLSVPIRAEGRIVGVTGIDISMDHMSAIIAGVHPFGKEYSYGFLLSNDGVGAAHPLEKAIGAHMRDFGIGENIIQAVAHGKLITEYGRSALLGGRSFTVYAPIQLGNSQGPWSLGLAVSLDKVLEGSRRMRNVSTALGIFSILVLFILVYFIADRMIVRPIRMVAKNLREIAEGEGNLTSRLPVQSGDEIGLLALRFNGFMEKLQSMMGQIQVNARNLGQTSQGLDAIASRMAGATEGTSQNAGRVAAAAQQMNSRVQAVAAAMEQASTNTLMVATASEEMTSTITEIATNSERARHISENAVTISKAASSHMQALEQAARQISSVTEAITDISDQTNLLALNATIEAARAGDAGKGFAVVAGEIKELARQTGKATQEIRERIEAVQGLTEETLKAMDEVVRVISEISDINGAIATAVEEQSAAVREIAGNISEASSGVQEVNTNISRISSVAHEIASDISEVNTQGDHLKNEAQAVADNSGKLSELGAELTQLVGRFRV